MPEVVDIKGVGPVLARACVDNGYGSVKRIADARVSEFVAVPGVSEVRAQILIDAAKSLLNGSSPLPAAVSTDITVEAEGKPVKKKSAKKKDAKKKMNGGSKKLASKNKKSKKDKKRSKKNKKKSVKKK